MPPQQQLLQKGAERQQWIQPIYWLVCIAIIIILPGWVGILALSQMLSSPESPNCGFVSQSTASVSVRLSCAQETASKQTVNDLLQAIALINTIPPDHELHSKINNLIKQWSMDILNQGEVSFQQGNLEQAVAIAHQIPSNASTNDLVDNQIQLWKSSWSKAEAIYETTQTKIHQDNWQEAYKKAIKLLDIGNKYWQTTKYQQLMESINTLQKKSEERQETEELADLDKARTLALSGEENDLTAAIAQAVRVKFDSLHYQEAQQLISKWRSELEIIKDQSYLEQADSLAMNNDLKSKQAAINEASKISSDHALYKKAQEKIQQWKAQLKTLENHLHTEHTRMVANKGDVSKGKVQKEKEKKAGVASSPASPTPASPALVLPATFEPAHDESL